MPFKDRFKQLRYMRQHAKKERQLLKDFKAKQKLMHDLEKKMISFAIEFLQERHNYSIESIPNFKGGMRLEKSFMIDSEEALKSATQAICNAEDEFIRNSPNVHKIGIVQDMRISLLNEKCALVWEIIQPLTKFDLKLLEEGKESLLEDKYGLHWGVRYFWDK